MKYELAKQLKDAGFPQGEAMNHQLVSSYGEDPTRIPNLSELIEACGDRFYALEQKVFVDMEVIGGKWMAYSNESNDLGIQAHIFEQGSTPEEAVAKLWLILNKKTNV